MGNTPGVTSSRPRVRVTEIGEFIRHNSCERRFKLEFDDRKLARQLPFADRLFNVIDPVLQHSGRERERQWEQSLIAAGVTDLTKYNDRDARSKVTPWAEFVDRLRNVRSGERAYGREIAVEGAVGAFTLTGQVDFLLLLWRDGAPFIRVVECKASRRDRTYHRIQVAAYRQILVRLLRDNAVVVGGREITAESIECVVARIDESTNESQAILDLPPFDLEQEDADLLYLLRSDGQLAEILRADLDSLSYRLEAKCDGCVFDVHCFPESARQGRLELLSIEPSVVRCFRRAGVYTIDQLAELDLAGAAARQVQGDPDFTANLERLREKARVRCSTLPGDMRDEDTYEVESLRYSGQGQLPAHAVDGQRLVRIYLVVDYDYVENRIGALTAHVTASDGTLITPFEHDESGKRWWPKPVVREHGDQGTDVDGAPSFSERPVQGRDVRRVKSEEWTGRYDADTSAERELLKGFMHDLVDAIAEVAATRQAPIHFYVWSRSEMKQLVEGCSRGGAGLLSHLRELLGCRESLEQLIYSCLQDEVDQRFALGWTGRGLSVATSLRWFGQRYHWTRQIAGEAVALDWKFRQDIFDFKTTLRLSAANRWADEDDDSAPKHSFEIRSRFYDSLSAPYWRAFWDTLRAPPGLSRTDAKLANAITRYIEGARPPRFLAEYLHARAHALRWIEERIRFKNEEIYKAPIEIAELRQFRLNVNSAAEAALDFLHLDQHISATDWLATQLVPPAYRLQSGRTIPLANVVSLGGNELTAAINLEGFGVDRAALEAACTISVGSFVRLTPCDRDPTRGQTMKQILRAGSTCKVESLDWETGEVGLRALPRPRPDRFLLQSYGYTAPGSVFTYATLDESPSDFVAGKVDRRLMSGLGGHVYQWLDPEQPTIPAQGEVGKEMLDKYRVLLETLEVSGGQSLAPDQVNAAIAGLTTRIQLLQGPPGTGKTTTTAAAVLLRILARRSAQDIMLVSAHTHAAVNTLLERIAQLLPVFTQRANELGLSMPPVRYFKVQTGWDDAPDASLVPTHRSTSYATFLKTNRAAHVLILGGTTSALLKVAHSVRDKMPWRQMPGGFQASTLIVDEASMMVFPHFLSLASLIRPDGEILLSGDHRQLSPILAHDWAHEDRPPVQLYQPFASAYEAVLRIWQKPTVHAREVDRSALRYTFRLPPLIRGLIARLYRLDAIELEGRGLVAGEVALGAHGADWQRVWAGDSGLFLVLHGERESRRRNELEARIVWDILAASGHQAARSVAVVTPHRAQRTLLRNRLADFVGEGRPVDLIDTVERLQGGERPTVIVSATASDPVAVSSGVEFILDLNRSNVAFSRTQSRLIVVCAETLINHIPADAEHYKETMLWKSLREICSEELFRREIDGSVVRVLTPSVETIGALAAAES